jgi:hypothetical protein
MQMPGGRRVQRAMPDIYTALVFVSMVALGVACGLVWRAASIVGPDGNAFGLQDTSPTGLKIKDAGS